MSLTGDVLVIGAAGEDSGVTTDGADNSMTNAGAAYVFERVGTSWNLFAYLKADDVAAGDAFGLGPMSVTVRLL